MNHCFDDEPRWDIDEENNKPQRDSGGTKECLYCLLHIRNRLRDIDHNGVGRLRVWFPYRSDRLTRHHCPKQCTIVVTHMCPLGFPISRLFSGLRVRRGWLPLSLFAIWGEVRLQRRASGLVMTVGTMQFPYPRLGIRTQRGVCLWSTHHHWQCAGHQARWLDAIKIKKDIEFTLKSFSMRKSIIIYSLLNPLSFPLPLKPFSIEIKQTKTI